MNRAMLLTGSGGAAIAVIRIDGPGVQDFFKQHFDRPARPGVCVYGRIIDGNRILDDAVVVLEENRADLNLHGGIWIVQEVLNLLALRGFEIVKWTPDQSWAADGESELDREIASHLPLAKSELTISVLLKQRQAWERMNNACLSSEALQNILADRTLEFLLHPPNVAIVGLPNVGKSTLANQLFGQQRSITADIPGTTRDWIGELANIDGLVVKLIDTPGQRHSDDEIETRAITAANSVIKSAELVILVIDPTQDAAQQKELLSRWPIALVVINKSDLANSPIPGLHTIASTGIGIDQLRTEIRQHFGVLDINENIPRCWTNRQRDQIQQTLRAKSPVTQ